jgi:hypothetical protein
VLFHLLIPGYNHVSLLESEPVFEIVTQLLKEKWKSKLSQMGFQGNPTIFLSIVQGKEHHQWIVQDIMAQIGRTHNLSNT